MRGDRGARRGKREQESEGEAARARERESVNVIGGGGGDGGAVYRGLPLNKCDRSSLDYITCGRVATTLRMHRGARISLIRTDPRHLSYRVELDNFVAFFFPSRSYDQSTLYAEPRLFSCFRVSIVCARDSFR